MLSISFTTEHGTTVTIDNPALAGSLDILQAAMNIMDTVEEGVINADPENEGRGIMSAAPILSGGVLTLLVPPQFEDEDEDEDDEDEDEDIILGPVQVQQDTQQDTQQDQAFAEAEKQLRLLDFLVSLGAEVSEDQSNVPAGSFRCDSCGDVHEVPAVIKAAA